jgi:hypothetical protein
LPPLCLIHDWRFKEVIPPAIKKAGAVYSMDFLHFINYSGSLIDGFRPSGLLVSIFIIFNLATDFLWLIDMIKGYIPHS